MNAHDRKAATSAYKERKLPAGIYEVRCAASGETWVGQTADLDKVQNRIWFTLRLGANPCPTLQAAWHRHGAEALSFAVLERVEESETDYLERALLKERAAHWRAARGADAL